MANCDSFAYIVTLFTQVDIDHMKEQNPPVLLTDYAWMSTPANAKLVYTQLSEKKMPPSWGGGGGPWPDQDIACFEAWIQGGYKP